MAVVAAGIVTGYDWNTELQFQVRLDLYSHTTENSASGVLTSQSFSVEDEEGFVNARVHTFVRDYITRPANVGGWGMTLAADDTIEIINPYFKAATAIDALNSKFSAFWSLTEDTGTLRADAVGIDGNNDLGEVGVIAREATADGSWAALFDGVDGFLVAPGAAFAVGDIDFAFTLWAKYTDHAADAPLLTVWDDGIATIVFALVRRTDTGMLEVRAYNGVSTDLYPSTFSIDGSGSVWNFIALWYEASTNTVFVQVNASTVQSFVLTTPLPTAVGTLQLYIGYDGSRFKGAMRRLGCGRFNPTAAERATLFNGGSGQDWPFELTPAPVGTGYVLLTNGVPAAAAGNIAAAYIGAHVASHQNGGSDEINVAGLSGLLADGQTSLAHAASHANGGADEISVSGLSGLLADSQTPIAHATSHQNGGSDEIVVEGLSGTLADPQVAMTHGWSHGFGQPDQISVGSLSGLLADPQTPIAHDIITAHDGFPTGTTAFLRADGTFAVPVIQDDSITYARIQNVTATDRVLGRSTAGAGDVEEIPCTAAGRALLDDATAADQRTTLGLAAMALRPTVATADLDAGAVTYAKMQDVSATDRLLGRDTAGAGDVEEITSAAVLAMLGAFSSVTLQAFTTVGANTYTPTAGMKSCIVITTGSGGGGGGADTAGGSADVGVGGGGGAGGTCIEAFSAATIGASQTVTIGVAGTVGSATNGTTGGAGGNTTFGALHTANGGQGGTGSGASAVDFQTIAGGAGGVPTGGLANITGGSGGAGNGSSGGTTITIGAGGDGGASFWGGGGQGGKGANIVVTTDVNAAGGAGLAYGSGGGGACSLNSTTGAAGGIGMLGFCLVIELG